MSMIIQSSKSSRNSVDSKSGQCYNVEATLRLKIFIITLTGGNRDNVFLRKTG